MFLDIGLNTVTGETGKVGTSNDWDGMVLDVASGQLITSISIDYTMDTGFDLSLWRLFDGPTTVFPELGFEIFAPSDPTPSVEFTTITPLGEGQYWLQSGARSLPGITGSTQE